MQFSMYSDSSFGQAVFLCGSSTYLFHGKGSRSLLALGACLWWVRQTKAIFLGWL